MPECEGRDPAGAPFARAARGVAMIAEAVADAARRHGPEEAAMIAETALRLVLDAANAARAAHMAALVAAKGAPRDAA